jgi:hypothetical protein
MVKITNIPPPPGPIPRPGNRTSSVNASVPTNKEKQDEVAARPFVERRKNTRDRRMQNNSLGPFNMRSGRDRRKNSGDHPSVEDQA